MGAAKIVSNKGEGLYTATLIVSGLDGALAWLANRRAYLEETLPTVRTNEDQAIAAVSNAVAATDLLIADWVSGLGTPPESLTLDWSASAMAYVKSATETFKLPEAITNAVGDVAKKGQQAARLTKQRMALQAEYLAIIQREAEVDRTIAAYETPIDVWCADYTTNLALGAEVATLEPPGEINPKIGGGMNIIPGYNTGSAYSPAYGLIQHTLAMTPPGFVWNMVMTTPWMKWQPLWRYAIVKAVNTDTLDVELQPIISQTAAYLGKDLTVNEPWESSMIGVEVQYMSCGTAAFEAGDEVIVQFNRIGVGAGLESYEPVVIGFKDHPKMCRAFMVTQPYGGGLRFVRAGRYTVPPTGANAGTNDWQGTQGALSWSGPYRRYSRPWLTLSLQYQELWNNTGWYHGGLYPDYELDSGFTSGIYMGGSLYIDAPVYVLGVALYRATSSSPLKMHIVGAGVNPDEPNYANLYFYELDLSTVPPGTALIKTETNFYSNNTWNPWRFNATGDQACGLRQGFYPGVTDYPSLSGELGTELWTVTFAGGSATLNNVGFKNAASTPYDFWNYFAADYVGDTLVTASIHRVAPEAGLTFPSQFDILVNDAPVFSPILSYEQVGESIYNTGGIRWTANFNLIQILSADLRKNLFVVYEYTFHGERWNRFDYDLGYILNTGTGSISAFIAIYYNGNQVHKEAVYEKTLTSSVVVNNISNPKELDPLSEYVFTCATIPAAPSEAMASGFYRYNQGNGSETWRYVRWYSETNIDTLLGVPAETTNSLHPVRII